jgi:hypothetical protein
MAVVVQCKVACEVEADTDKPTRSLKSWWQIRDCCGRSTPRRVGHKLAVGGEYPTVRPEDRSALAGENAKIGDRSQLALKLGLPQSYLAGINARSNVRRKCELPCAAAIRSAFVHTRDAGWSSKPNPLDAASESADKAPGHSSRIQC